MNWWRPTPSKKDFPQYRSTARTHVGKVRLVNEDRFLEAPDKCLWVVADGMGGHFAGDVAATMTVQGLAATASDPRGISLQRIAQSLVLINNSVEVMLSGQGRTGGATFAGLWINCGVAHIFWMGDSRVYRLRDGFLERLSHDHSLVQALLDSGAIEPDAASTHPQANVVTRALGIERDAAAEFRQFDVLDGDQFLICSDGVTSELTDLKIASCMDIDQISAADRLVSLFQNTVARDNMTFVMIGPQ